MWSFPRSKQGGDPAFAKSSVGIAGGNMINRLGCDFINSFSPECMKNSSVQVYCDWFLKQRRMVKF